MTKPAPQGKQTSLTFLPAAVLSLFFLLYSLPALAKIQQYDFENAEDYRFDPKKIEVSNGTAHLVSIAPLHDATPADFERGKFTQNTWAAKGRVELASPTLYETRGADLPQPLSSLPETGRTALWHLDEPTGTNVLDDVSRTVAKNSDTQIVSGQTGFGYARQFDGVKSHVFIPNYQTFRFDGPFSLEGWIRPSRTAGGKPQTLISRWQTVGGQRSFALQISAEGKLDFLFSSDGATTAHEPGETVLSPGLWYHVAVTFDGDKIQLYLNGVPDAKPLPYQGPLYSTSGPIYLGALVTSRPDEFFEGVMDEVSFYDRALTETEALTHAGNTRGLTGLWHFNERGGQANDISGYGLVAFPQGNPVYEAEGKLNKAISFKSKDQYFETAPSFRFAAQNRMTLEIWVRPDRLPGFGEKQTLIASNGAEGSFSLSLAGPDGHVTAFASSLNPSEISGHTALVPGVWQHVAVTWGDGTARLYLNGISEAEQPYSGILSTGKSALRFGQDAKNIAGLAGSIDEASYYRSVRTGEEIAADAGLYAPEGIYTSGVKDAGEASSWRAFSWKKPFAFGEARDFGETGLLSLYHLDEVDGNSALQDSKAPSAASPVGTYPVPGIFSKARWFETPGRDKIISQQSLPSLSTFTLECWFEFSSAAPGVSDRIFSIGDGDPTAYRAQDGRIHINMAGAREIISSRTLMDTQWHHLALTADGSNLFLYIDGTLDGNSPFLSATAEAPLVLGNLKTTDTFRGAIDEFVFYNSPLSREKIGEHALAGKIQAVFLARTSEDGSFTNVPWRGPSGAVWQGTLPSSTTAGLWHFDIKKLRGESSTALKDESPSANDAVAYGNARSVPGLIGESVAFNGAGDYLVIPASHELNPEHFTVSLWVKPDGLQDDAVLIDKRYNKGAPVFSSFALELTEANRVALRLGYSNGYNVLVSDRAGEIAAGRWNHIAATYNGREARLYINGKLAKTSILQEAVPYDDGSLYVGRYGSGDSRYFRGEIDELVLEARDLSEEEIREQFQNADPSNVFGKSPAENPGLDRGRYFQYQIRLFTQKPDATPQVEAVEIQSNAFMTGRPSVSNNSSVSFADIEHFQEKPGARHQGAITYQLSNDGSNWFYHNGRHWVIANGAEESNTAEQIEGRIRDFPKEAGIGSFYFKAFLYSPAGLEQAELDAVEIEYLPNKLTVTSPNGEERWETGNQEKILWNSAGEVKSVNLEYSKDDFKKDFNTIAKNLANNGSYVWAVPDDPAAGVKIRVTDSLDPRVRDTSDIAFHIVGNIVIIAPNFQERWAVGSPQEIRWRTSGNIPQVKIDFSTDDFQNQIFSVVDSIKNEGKFEWKVPDNISSHVRVRIADTRDLTVFDTSNDTFSITGVITVLSPAEGSRLVAGFDQEIRWQTTGTMPALRLEYFTSKSPERVLVSENLLNQGSTTWTVPDNIDKEVHLRLSDPRDPLTFGESRAFAITGGVRLLNPQGAVNWNVGTKRKIAWQSIGKIPYVDIEYQTPNGDWKPIQKWVLNTGEYVWQVPQLESNSVNVRVADSNDPLTFSASQSPVKVIPGFFLKFPNGKESLKIGSHADLMWETKGNAEKVKLEYSKDKFAKDVHEIIPEASNIGRYSWIVPDDATTDMRVRVSDPKNPEAYDVSDAPVRVFGGFNIKIPAGGEKFDVASQATLEWETLGTIREVKIEYSHDDFNRDARTIVMKTENKNRYTWTVPDDIGGNYSLRISDANDPGTSEISAAQFSIIGDFRLLEPAGGEDYTAGTVVPIRWRGAGSVPVVRLDYSEDNFEKSFVTLADAAPNKGIFEWTVPNLIDHKFRIRVWDPSQPESMDVMSKPARIIGGFRLTQPNGGEVLFTGDPYEIKWDSFGTMPRVKLEFSSDGFNQDVQEITDAYENSGHYIWNVPDAVSGAYRVRISDPRDARAYDISNADFRIRSHFAVLSPNGGEGWPVGSKQMIRWQTTASVASVDLEYSIDDFGSVVPIAKDIPNTGNYEWTVPDQVSQSAKVRIRNSRDAEGNDVSDASFRIQAVFNIVKPNGGEVWKVGEQRAIEWKTTGEAQGVRLEYSRDGFASESKTIIDSIPNSGSFTWTVPDDLSQRAKVRVVDLRDEEVKDASDDNFEIAAAFLMMAPNGGEAWHATEKREINWSTLGSAKEVNLEISQDNFKTEPYAIDRGILNTGRFIWEVPEKLGEDFKIRVCDTDSPKICDVSDNVFSVRSPLEMTFPRGGESWAVGTDQEIRWNTNGRVDRVRIDYAVSPDALKTVAAPAPDGDWKNLIEELPNEGHFLFKVPDAVSRNIYFRVSSYDIESLYAVNREPVRFLGGLTVRQPAGGEVWFSGDTQKITWDTIGTIPQVRLEYSSDNFKNDVNLLESAYNNSGSYGWELLGTGMTLKVRLSDEKHNETFSVSPEFKILPRYTVTSPNGGERLLPGDKTMVKWDVKGTGSRLSLSYGERQGVSYIWKPIGFENFSKGHYEWTVPDAISSDVLVRVEDAMDPAAADQSDASFKILAGFKAVSPKPGDILIVGANQQIKWETRGTLPAVKIEYADAAVPADQKLVYQVIEPSWNNSGSYYWTVPDSISEKTVLRISDPNEPDAFVVSEPFKIRGALEFLGLEAKPNWPIASLQTLQWKTTGSIPFIKLEYTTDDGKTWKPISDSQPNTGSFGWTIPDDASTQVKVRISDTRNAAVFAVTERPATIAVVFNLTSPAVNEVWIVGSQHKVTWQTTGALRKIWIEYMPHDKWLALAGPVGNENSIDWTVPDTISSQVKIRIKDADNEAAIGISPAFRISGALEVAKPLGGEVWTVGSKQILEWKTTGSIPKVNLQLLTTDGSPVMIAQSMANENRLEWTVPDQIGDGLKFRVSDERDEKVESFSPAEFSIIAKFGILNPKGGEKWAVESDQQITWRSQGTVPAVLLEYSRDDFYRDINVIASNVPNTGAAVWTIPDAVSDRIRIRLSDMRDMRTAEVSETFKIHGTLGFAAPAGGEKWIVGSKQTLLWKTTGSVPRVRLEYSRDDFRQDVQVIENDMENKGRYEWTIPDIVSNTLKLRLGHSSDTDVQTVSGMFEVKGALHLKSPVGGEVFQVLSAQKIAWDTTGTVSKVRLEYSSDDFKSDVKVLAQDFSNQGDFEWTVPDTIGKNFKVRISNANDFAVTDSSPAAFEIRGALALTTATSGKRWTVGSEQEISWEAIGTIPAVRLEYSTDDFQTVTVIADQLKNKGRFTWQVPDDVSSHVRLRVVDAANPDVFAASSDPASIVGKLEIEKLPAKMLGVGQKVDLKWKTTGTIPVVRLEYGAITGEGVEEWKLITASASNENIFSWQVPDDAGRDFQVRISDSRDPQVSDALRDVFSIMPVFDFITPAGGERWIVGTRHDLLWKTSGSVPKIKLFYSRDHFAKDVQPVSEETLNTGRMTWSVPDAVSDSVEIRIQDSRFPEAFGSSSAFSVIGDFVIARPAEDVIWKVGSKQRIEWQTAGTIPYIRVEYSVPVLNSVAQWTGMQADASGIVLPYQVIQDRVPNENAYEWTVPDKISRGARIRVLNAADHAIFAVSPGSIKIEGDFEWKTPVAGETWTAGEQKTLEWKTTGTIPFVTLEYSRDNFQQDIQPIEAQVQNRGQYLWSVPDAISDHVFLRVRDSRDENVFAVSPQLRIRGALSLAAPAGGEAWTVGSEHEIKWTASGSIPMVRIQYSRDGFAQDINTIEPSIETSRLRLGEGQPFTYLWKVPDAIADQVQIRIHDGRDEQVTASSQLFRILPAFHVIEPAGGEVWTVGTSHNIRWETSGTVPQVRLEYSRDGFKRDAHVIETAFTNTGLYDWTVPDAISDSVWVRVVDPQNEKVWATHEKPFTVQGALFLTAPGNGEVFRAGSVADLEWKTSGTISEVRLEYFVPGRPEIHTITDRLANKGSFAWKVPDDIPASIHVRVSDAAHPNIFSETVTPVRVQGDFEMLTLGRKEKWVVGQTYGIVWKHAGTVPQVKLEFSHDDFKQDIGTIEPLLNNTGSASWTVPDALTGEIRLRVSDSQNADVFALSTETADILGKLNLLTPSGGESWEVGSRQELIWNTAGRIPKVRLEYSFDAFRNDKNLIEASASNAGRYVWQVPDAIHSRVWVRVSDAMRNDVFAVSQAPFRIHGKLALDAPRGGEIFKVGDTVDMAWKTVGNIPSVTLQYSTDNFASAAPLAVSIRNEGHFTWRVPDKISDNFLIRICDAKDSQVCSALPQPVKIQGVISFMAPRTSEFWRTGTQHELVWQTTGSIPDVRLEYSTDRFGTTTLIADQMKNTGRYSWTVPDMISKHVELRLSDAHDQSVYAVSIPLEIGGELQLLSPNGGEVWKAGATEEIRWNTTGTIPAVKIEISGDGFQNDVRVISESVSNSGNFPWKVWDAIHPQLQIRISDARTPSVSSVTRGSFKIQGDIRLLAPRGGEKWTVGSKQKIRWESDGTIAAVRLEYSRNNFVTHVPIATQVKNDGTYEWEVPSLAGEQINLRVSDASDTNVSASTAGPVEIQGALDILSPQGGEVWQARSQQAITWHTTGVLPTVSVAYSTDHFESQTAVAENIVNTGSFLWTVPDLQTRSLRLRVFDPKHPEVFSQIENNIEVQGSLQLSAPAGGEIWLVGTEHAIQWNSVGGIKNVRLEYSTDHFRTVLPIDLSAPNKGEYKWNLPDSITREAEIRISDVENPGVQSSTARPFEIRGSLVMLSPAGGEVWSAGSRHPISWQSIGTIPQVQLDYSSDNFASEPRVITPALANKGVYYWEVPSVPASAVKIRVRDAENADVYAVSGEVRVSGQLEMLFPGSGESFVVGERVDLRWRATDNVASVKLEYSIDDFQTTTVISDFVANNGHFEWNVPDTITENLRVRVSDASDATVFSFSKLPSSVHGSFKFVTPKGTESWRVGSVQRLSWETAGNIPVVRLEYSGDNFQTSVPIAAHYTNTGAFDWTVPETLKPEIRFRVSDVDAPSVSAVSPESVKITGGLNLIVPAGGERWIAGEEKTIRWSSEGYIPHVDLEYSKDNFKNDIHLIASGVPNVGNTTWKVPHDLSKEVYLRIKNSDDTRISAVSAMPFQIGLYRVRWIVKDAKSGEHLTGLTLTDSTGKTEKGMSSPLELEYPYGIYTTVWSKPGYAEFKSTWLAEKDETFLVQLEPDSKVLDLVRVDFEYVPESDIMKIRSWYEKGGKPVPTVIKSEIRIYDGQKLIRTLISSNPDTEGFFHMVWDTSLVSGDARYTASVILTTTSGQTVSGPVSYQLDIPVKPRREPVARTAIRSDLLKSVGVAPKPSVPAPLPKTEPIFTPAPVSVAVAPPVAKINEEPLLPAAPQAQPQPEPVTPSAAPVVSESLPQLPPVYQTEEEKSEKYEKDNSEMAYDRQLESATTDLLNESRPGMMAPSSQVSPKRTMMESVLTVPQKAIMGETLSISYKADADAGPVVDIYDGERKLMVSGAPMNPGKDGQFVFLLPVKGSGILPGRPITVTVIERQTGRFKSAQIPVESVSSALGLNREAGTGSVLEVLSRLERTLYGIKNADNPDKISELIGDLKRDFYGLSGLLDQGGLSSAVVEKINDLAWELSKIVAKKGYDAGFLSEEPLHEGSDQQTVDAKMRDFKSAIAMLQKLYFYSSGGSKG